MRELDLDGMGIRGAGLSMRNKTGEEKYRSIVPRYPWAKSVARAVNEDWNPWVIG